MFYIYKMWWRVTYASCCCLQIFETSLLAFVIANGDTVSLNAPWGLVTTHPKSSAGVSSTTILTFNFSTWMFTCDVSCEILIQNKNWRIKLWRIYGHSPNSPMFSPTKVSLYMVLVCMCKLVLVYPWSVKYQISALLA